MNIKHALGIRIRTLRNERGLTQEQLAEKIDRSLDAVSLIERGENWPTSETIERIAKALDVDAPDLFDGLFAEPEAHAADPFAQARELLRRIPKEDLPLAADLLRALEKRSKEQAPRA